MIFQNVVKLSFHYFQPSCLIYKVKNYLQEKFGVHSIRENHEELTAAVYLQVSTVSQALIFVTRSRSWSFVERPGILLMVAFLIAQLVSILFVGNLKFEIIEYC